MGKIPKRVGVQSVLCCMHTSVALGRHCAASNDPSTFGTTRVANELDIAVVEIMARPWGKVMWLAQWKSLCRYYRYFDVFSLLFPTASHRRWEFVVYNTGKLHLES